MANYVNFNARSLPPLTAEPSGGMLSRVMSAGKHMSTNTWMIVGGIVLLIAIAVAIYVYYVAPQLKPQYQPNREHMSGDAANGQTAELLFFYADWCPHCKAAKPIWNDLKADYEHKTINGYKVVFTDVDCSEESSEVEKMMNQYSVEGYPTIKLVKDGQIIEYDAKPSSETLTKFLNTVL